MADQVFGRYEIIGELGRGGMATVYHARDPEFQREVSLKVLPREFLHNSEFRNRFRREARTIAALEHPAIVPVYDFGEHEGQPYLVMRYMGGGSLSDRLGKGPLPLPEVVRIVDQIAPAIDYANYKGIVHRDLKPANILFDTDDHAFIADFGIAKLLHSTSQMTESGAFIGTPAYMSPEQIEGLEALDGRSDGYSLGVVLFEALSGRTPFVANNAMGLVSAHLHQPVPDISALHPGLPKPLADVMYRALAKKRDDRYLTAQELAADLHGVLQGDAPSTAIPSASSQPTAIPAPTTASPRRALIGAIAGSVLLILIVLGVALRGGIASGKSVETQQVVIQASVSPDEPQDNSEETTQTEPPAPITVPELESVMSYELRNSWIAFASDMAAPNVDSADKEQPQFDEIYTIHADGTRLTRLTINEDSDRQPSWSPDGTQIVFASNRDDSDWEIYVMDATGLNQSRLTESPGDDTDPAWSPDGTQIAFVSERDGNPELYLMNADGSDPVRLTNDDGRDESPAWSPDGTQIAFNSSRAGSYDLYVISASGDDLVRLTKEMTTDWLPTWSPDGSRIAYATEVFHYAIGLVDPRSISQWSFEYRNVLPTQPSWSSDRRWLAISTKDRPSRESRTLRLALLTDDLTNLMQMYDILTVPGVHQDPAWSWAP